MDRSVYVTSVLRLTSTFGLLNICAIKSVTKSPLKSSLAIRSPTTVYHRSSIDSCPSGSRAWPSWLAWRRLNENNWVCRHWNKTQTLNVYLITLFYSYVEHTWFDGRSSTERSAYYCDALTVILLLKYRSESYDVFYEFHHTTTKWNES